MQSIQNTIFDSYWLFYIYYKWLADLNTIWEQFIENSKGTNHCITICVLQHHTDIDPNWLPNTVNTVIQTSNVSQESYI